MVVAIGVQVVFVRIYGPSDAMINCGLFPML
jgi:hypothetical protein